MKFGIFDHIDARGEPLQKTYEDRLALLQTAEAAGFAYEASPAPALARA